MEEAQGTPREFGVLGGCFLAPGLRLSSHLTNILLFGNNRGY